MASVQLSMSQRNSPEYQSGPAWAEEQVRTPERPRWRVTCSCGWEREASSAWAASAILRLHVQHLGDPTIEHTVTIEEPPIDAPPGTQLPLI